MSDEPEDYLVTLETLGIDINRIVHVLLVGETELIGEMVEDLHTTDYVLINPIKIIKDHYVDENGNFREASLLIEWNSSINDPVIYVKRHSVITISNPTENTIKAYTHTVKLYYFPEEIVTEVPIQESVINNVISLQKYKKSKSL